MDIKSGDAQLTGVDKDFDAKPKGVRLEAANNSYNEAYAAVQEQGSKINVYVLAQQGPTEGMVFVENNIKKHKIQVSTSIAQQRLDKLTRVKHKNVALT